MKVLFDYQAFDMQVYGGVSNCFVKLIECLPKDVDYEIAIRESDNVHLKGSSLNIDCSPRRLYEDIFISKKSFKGRGVLYRQFSSLFPNRTALGMNRRCSVEALERGNYDVFHPTFFYPYFLPHLHGKPFVITVHDMIPELYHGKRGIQVKMKPILCEKASHIIAVSEKTKQDLVNILHVPEDKITVIYHGAPDIDKVKDLPPIIDGRYILYVGRRGGYKSFIPMMRILVNVFQRHKDIKMVCTGPEFSKEEISVLQKIGVIDRVSHICANDDEMISLYRHALCFIFPSQYEGFGIPILEAYGACCPVLLNEASCFPEIAADAAVFFHLNEMSSDLEQVMEQFLHMSLEERQRLLNLQSQRLCLFSWQRSALKIAEVYNAVIRN